MTTAVPEMSWTDLVQRPAQAANRLRSARAIRLRRRDDEDLLLMSANRADSEAEVVDFAARLLAELMHDNTAAAWRHLVRHLVLRVLPWARFLPADGLDEMMAELGDLAPAAVAVDNLSPVVQLLAEWRHTAEVYADPDLYATLTRDHPHDVGPVPEPDIESNEAR